MNFGTRASARTHRGVSALLQGDKTALVPVGTERIARRRQELHTTHPAEHNGNGCCNGWLPCEPCISRREILFLFETYTALTW